MDRTTVVSTRAHVKQRRHRTCETDSSRRSNAVILDEPWVMGGDRNPDDVLEHVRALAEGIRSQDERHLMTAHCFPDAAAMDEYETDEWLTLNQTYTYRIVHRKLLEDYAREPVRTFIDAIRCTRKP